MIAISDVRNIVRKGLADYLGIKVIIADGGGVQPKYPFATVKMTSMQKEAGYTERFIDADAVHEQAMEVSLSFNFYSDDMDDAANFAMQALEYFEFAGHDALHDKDVVIVRTYPLDDRTTFLVTDYEYRWGFDVDVRVMAVSKKQAEFIESVTFHGLELKGGD